MQRAAAKSSSTSASQPNSNLVDITDIDLVWKSLEGWQQELIARRWVKRTGRYYAKVDVLQNRWFHKFVSVCRQPAGRADGQRGSQQAFFEMDIPDQMCLQYLELRSRAGFQCHYKERYGVSAATGQIEWKKSSTIDTYYMDDKDAVATYLSFEKREASAHLAAFGCTKGVVKRGDEGVKVVCSIIPPLVIEVCKRSLGRIVLAVTCNILTFNDHDAVDLPPLFAYAEGERASFRRMVLQHLEGMANNNHKLSRRMQALLPPCYGDGEAEGEEASESSEDGSEISARSEMEDADTREEETEQ